LVGNAKAIASGGGSICLAGPNKRVRRMLEITNLARYFRILDDIAEAIEGLDVCTVAGDSSRQGGN
jgi:anti-anti-sigma regulatory factor